MNAPKTGTCTCYCGCGCGRQTGGHFAPGHDARAAAWLDKLDPGPSSIAVRVLLADYGPGGRNL